MKKTKNAVTETKVTTRKIQLFTENKEFYSELWQVQRDVAQMANRMMERLGLIKALENEGYISGIIKKSQDFNELMFGKEGLTEMSFSNQTYEVSCHPDFAHISSYIRGSMAKFVLDKFKADWFEVSIGKKTMANFRSNIPICIMKDAIRNLSPTGFNFLKEPLLFVFGKDRSNNKTIIKRIIDGTYKLADSKIQINKKGIFLLMSYHQPLRPNELDTETTAEIDITYKCPIFVKINRHKEAKEVGSPALVEKARLQLQTTYRAAQASCKYARSGHGRTRKMQSMDRFRAKEKNTAQTLCHGITREVVKFLVRERVSSVVIITQNVKEDKDLDPEEKKYVIRNWGHFLIQEQIKYKAQMEGISVRTITDDNNEKKEAAKAERKRKKQEKENKLLNSTT